MSIKIIGCWWDVAYLPTLIDSARILAVSANIRILVYSESISVLLEIRNKARSISTKISTVLVIFYFVRTRNTLYIGLVVLKFSYSVLFWYFDIYRIEIFLRFYAIPWKITILMAIVIFWVTLIGELRAQILIKMKTLAAIIFPFSLFDNKARLEINS